MAKKPVKKKVAKPAKKKVDEDMGPALPIWADAQGKVFRPSMKEGLVEIPEMDIYKLSLSYDLEERLRLPDGKVFFHVRRFPGASDGGFTYDPFASDDV